jgi:hypothetical protein
MQYPRTDFRLLEQILTTAVSALHMLRYNAQDFTFHVIPTSIADRSTTGEQGHHHFERGGRSIDVPTELPDGCGSLALVNNQAPTDRSLIFVVRPPWLIGTTELKDFVKAAVSIRSQHTRYSSTHLDCEAKLETRIPSISGDSRGTGQSASNAGIRRLLFQLLFLLVCDEFEALGVWTFRE